MKPKTVRTSLCLAVGLGLATMLSGGAAWSQPADPGPPHYAVTELGTLGGTFSLAFSINNRGQIDGTSTLPGDAVMHSFVIENGPMTDLGTLGGPNSQSYANLNQSADVTGISELAQPDRYGEDFCGLGTHLTCVGFVWRDGAMLQLATLGGDNGQATAINNLGLVADFAETIVPDTACPAPQVLHYRPVIWRGLEVQQVLPLYGTDTEGAAFWINNRGETVGASGVCAAFNGDYGLPFQPLHALLWRDHQAIDLGNLGGQFNTAALGINDRSEVVGTSGVPGDTASGPNHAFLWRHGKMIDLGVLPGDVKSGVMGISNRGQITGVSVNAQGQTTGLLWQNGKLYNLNDLIPANSPYYILQGFDINDRGQIAGYEYNFQTGEIHGFVANPVAGGANAAPVLGAAAAHSTTAKVTLSPRLRERIMRALRGRRTSLPFTDTP